MAEQLLGFFFPPDQPVAVAVNGLIAAILLTSLLLLYKNGVRWIQVERQQLARLRAKVNEKDELEPLEVTTGIRPGSLVCERVEDLGALKKAGDEIDQDALAAVAISRFENSLKLVSWSSYGVVLLGFSGTLIGLTRSVKAASQSLGGLGDFETIEQATEPLIDLVGGIHVAFSTTLAGVLAAVVLGPGLALARRRQAVFLAELERFTQVALIPRYRTSAGVALVRTARKLAELEKRLDESLRQIIEELETRGGALHLSIESGFQGLVDTFQEKSKTHLDYIESLHAKIHKYLGEQEEKVPTLSETLSVLREASSIIRDDAGEYRAILAEFSATIEEASSRQAELLKESFEDQGSGLQTTLDRLEGVMAEGARGAKDVLDRLEGVLERTDKREVVGQRVVEDLDIAAQDLRTATDRLRHAVSIHENTAGELHTLLRRLPVGGRGTFGVTAYSEARRGLIDDGASGDSLERSVPPQEATEGAARAEEVSTDGGSLEERTGESGHRDSDKDAGSARSLFKKLFGKP